MLIDIIRSAIREKKELLLKVKSDVESEGNIEVFMQPYVLGVDVLERNFVWGYLTHSHVFYKIDTDMVLEAETIEIPYEVLENVIYHECLGEEQLCVIDGLNIDYAMQSIC